MRIIKILLVFCYCFTSFSQEDSIYYKQFTEEDGIDLGTIQALAVDNNGFLWLGGGMDKSRSTLLDEVSPVRLQRFNGLSFHTINLPENDISQVVDIYKRPDGKFYLVTQYALYLFDPITTQFNQIPVPDNSGISNVFEYQGKQYILTQNKLEVIINTIHPDLYLEEKFRFTTTVNKILIDSKTQIIPFEDIVIISDDNFPITFTDWQGNVKHIIDPEQFDNEREFKTDKKWIDEYFEFNGNHYVLLYNKSQLFQILPEKLKIKPIAGTEQEFLNKNLKTYQDPNGNTIIVTHNQDQVIIKSFQNSDTIETIYKDSSFKSISSFSLLSSDLTKNIWFSTAGTLNYIKFPEEKITTFLPNIQTRAMTSLTEGKHLIASENKGLYLFNSEDVTLTPYPIFQNGNTYTPNSPRNFFLDGTSIWSSDYKLGIIKWDTVSHQVVSFRHYPVSCMVRPTDSTIVYGTNKYNLMQFNIETSTHSPLVKTDSLFIQDIEWREEDNIIIASTDKGLLTYDLYSKKSKFYNSPNELPDPYLLMGDYHPEYSYLQGSRKGIITSFNPKTETFKTLYKDELKTPIATILFDDKDNWWINTFDGYVSFNPKSKERHRFSVKDGFTNNEANRFSALKTTNGFLVGTVDGVNFFDPEMLQAETRNERLIPLRIKVYDKKEGKFKISFDQSAFAKAQPIILPSENRTLEVDFALSQVDITRNERYRYRLDQNEWVDLDNSQTIRFPNLAPGNYNLEIEALNFSGKKVGDSLMLPINSRNFFYKTWWFFLSISLVAMMLLFYLFRQQKMRKEMQEQFSEDLMSSQEQERSRIAKDLHDSVGQQLTLIKRRLQEKGDIDMSELANNTLEEVRHISRNLYPAILKQLGLSGSIEQLLYEVDEQTDLFVSSDIDDIDHLFDQKASLHIYRFIQENVSNVIKHAFKEQSDEEVYTEYRRSTKALSVSLKLQNDKVLLVIKDNGKGFNVVEKHKNYSLGLKTLQERIRILDGELIIESTTDSGTKTIAQFPY